MSMMSEHINVCNTRPAEGGIIVDPVKRLAIELPGIIKALDGYTSDSGVTNAASQLKFGIQSKDIEGIKYCVDCIVQWYNDNIPYIQSNQFVTNPGTHLRYAKILTEIRVELEDYTFEDATEQSHADGQPLVFISHRSSDKKYGDALAEFITGLGVKRDQLIYTSSPLHKIPLDKNIYEFLRENIHRKMFMIILWSEEYLDSPACLNEMGAAWVVQCDYTNIYTPTFSFGNPKYHQCAVDTRKMGAVLKNDDHCRAAMIELKNKILELFDLGNDEIKNSVLLNNFMQQISAE